MVTDLPPTAEEIEAKEKEIAAQLAKEESSDTPTPEELEAQKEKDEQEAKDAEEARLAKEKADKIAAGEDDEQVDDTGPDDEADDDKEEEKQPQKTGPTETPEQKITRLEKERQASTVEYQIISRTKKEFEDKIAQAQALPEPTDEQVRAEVEAQGEDWDSLSTFFKNIAKNNLHNKLKNDAVTAIQEEQKYTLETIEARKKEIDVYSIHPDTLKKFPRLEGRQDEFNTFASKPTRLSLDLEDLATLFLANVPPAEKHKGKMFETGNGGKAPERKKNNGKLSIAEGAALQQRDYNKYLEYLAAGKISEDIDQG